MNNIVLIGMPSSGKSTVGVLLAKHLGFSFLDTDLLIQEREGKLLHEIIEEEGLDRFLTIENEVISSLSVKNTVIATGGSAVYGKGAMAHLKETGTVIYLSIPFDTMEHRLGDYRNRGVVLREGATLKDLYTERTALYKAYADYTVNEAACGNSLTATTSAVTALAEEIIKE